MAIISVKNLSKTYEYYKKQPGFVGSLSSLFRRKKLYTQAIKNIFFDIEKGELVGFLGPNGAGKTTTLKMLSGILYPTSGKAEILGFKPWERKRAYQKKFSVVLGLKSQLWLELPPYDNFLLNKEIYEIGDRRFKENLDELTELLKIRELLNIQVRKLSLGQRLKCELVAALLHSPEVLFLDEPTIGLDVVSQQAIREFIKKQNQEKKTTILLTSHYMEDVEELCKRVIIINHGQIIYDGELSNLISRFAKKKVLNITFIKEIDKKDIEKFGEIKKFERKRVILEVSKERCTGIASQILNKFPVDDILIDEISVEEIIRKIFIGNR
jgi:ABC-2 type transport system ATP-binding protein